MWVSFLLSAAVFLAFAYIPGFLFLRSLGKGSVGALVCAPAFSILGICLVSLVECSLGVSCSWASVFIPVLMVGLLAFAMVGACSHDGAVGKNASTFFLLKTQFQARGDAFWLLLCLALSLVVSIWGFVLTLDGPYSLVQENDLVAHVNSIRDAVATGQYYRFDMGAYPQGWYVCVALLMDAVGAPMGVAMNAVNFVLLAAAFPSAMCLYLRRVFAKEGSIARWAPLLPLGFAAFPWGLLLSGPLYPNYAGFCLLPAAMLLFMDALEPGISHKRRAMRFAIFALSVLCLVFLHPTVIFAGIVLLTPYCIHLIWRFFSESDRLKTVLRLPARWVYSILFVAFVVAVWSILFCLPMLGGLVWFQWDSYATASDAIISILAFCHTKVSTPQLALGALVVIGVVYCVAQRRFIWILAAYIMAATMLFSAIATEGFMKHYLTGFWYTDPFRVASVVAMASMPLVAIGLQVCFEICLKLLARFAKGKRSERPVAVAIATLFLVCGFVSGVVDLRGDYHEMGFGTVRRMLSEGNSLTENDRMYDKEEYNFVERVKQVIPDGELVVNIPFDGSALAVGLNDLNVMNRDWYGYDAQSVESDEAVIRNSLRDIASDSRVRQAVESSGADYVLVLDCGNKADEGVYAWPYDRSQWRGISSIDDSTPGFETVLSEGDMRLYRISLG